jgi:hypothetical protein
MLFGWIVPIDFNFFVLILLWVEPPLGYLHRADQPSALAV